LLEIVVKERMDVCRMHSLLPPSHDLTAGPVTSQINALHNCHCLSSRSTL